MTRIMTAELVSTYRSGGGVQRFYKLSKPISKFTNGLNTIEEELNETKKKLEPKWSCLIPDGASDWDIICISDAHTHSERLVFLGCRLENNDPPYSRLNSLHLDGTLTMMIHGGNARKMHPDKVYLRRLAAANGYKFGGIIHA